MMAITSVPITPEFVKGVINLRGKVLPVVDLRLRFGILAEAYNDKTSIIVVEIDTGEKIVQLGAVVDSVSEVFTIQESDIEDAPAFGTVLNTKYILGMAKNKSSVKILMEIDKALGRDELGRMGEMG
jgi:purine-binding chemotaxis protein CheW